jgi:hypothetical protein
LKEDLRDTYLPEFLYNTISPLLNLIILETQKTKKKQKNKKNKHATSVPIPHRECIAEISLPDVDILLLTADCSVT